MYDENENLLNEKFHYSSSISMIKFLELQRKWKNQRKTFFCDEKHLEKLLKINFHMIFINFAIFFRSATMYKIRFSPEKLIYVYGKNSSLLFLGIFCFYLLLSMVLVCLTMFFVVGKQKINYSSE